eukprot:TRINITY_DN6760_c0_g1_i1.p1 TRINITY_DN6760_c0_g1~~TRINITY_DN6760_c0_g1_i1.p1  ORF type:complete len:246 (+),score=85.39 TRINITY_DN6760_c0_g1_i1:349-1086(+)
MKRKTRKQSEFKDFQKFSLDFSSWASISYKKEREQRVNRNRKSSDKKRRRVTFSSQVFPTQNGREKKKKKHLTASIKHRVHSLHLSKSRMGDVQKPINLVKKEEKEERELEREDGLKKRRKEKKPRNYPKNRKSVMRRRPLPPHLFSLEGMSDAMDNFIEGRVTFSHFEDESMDPFYEDYREFDREFDGLHFPSDLSYLIAIGDDMLNKCEEEKNDSETSVEKRADSISKSLNNSTEISVNLGEI